MKESGEVDLIKEKNFNKISIKENPQKIGWSVFIETENKIYIYNHFQTQEEALQEVKRLVESTK